MTLNEIKEIEDLSTRTYNICRSNWLYNLASILDYYEKNNTFKNLRNCGVSANAELIAICKKYQITSEINSLFPEEKNSFEFIVANLNRKQRSIINSFIDLNTKKLTVRARNAISTYLNNNFKIRNFAYHIIFPVNFNPIIIPNVGRKTSIELEAYIKKIKNFIKEINTISDDIEIITLKNELFVQQVFGTIDVEGELLEAESIFVLVDCLLKENLLFDDIQSKIFKESLKIYENEKEHSLNDLAEIIGLSRERVRQIRQYCLNELFNKLLIIKNFHDDLPQKYGIDLDSDFINIDKVLVENINNIDNTNFTKVFYTYLIYVYYSDSFSLIGEVDDVLRPRNFRNRSRHNWINFFIVSNELIAEMDFISFVDDIDRRLSETIKETYEFNFRSYISKFIYDSDIDTIDLIYPIAEKIINEEFNLYLDLNDNITFKRTTVKTIPEYVYDALDSIGEVADAETIYNKVIELNPNFDGDLDSIRPAMKRDNGFVPISRSGFFGLKKWEKEKQSFKGGTIRSISHGYLEKFNEPIHIAEITAHVLKYRPNSNQKSIYYNLRADETNSFIFYKNSYIGLKNKEYSSDFELLERSRNSWESRYDELKEFLFQHNRLPRTRSNSKKERKLYRWLYIQRRSIDNNKLSAKKEKCISKIIKDYLK